MVLSRSTFTGSGPASSLSSVGQMVTATTGGSGKGSGFSMSSRYSLSPFMLSGWAFMCWSGAVTKLAQLSQSITMMDRNKQAARIQRGNPERLDMQPKKSCSDCGASMWGNLCFTLDSLTEFFSFLSRAPVWGFRVLNREESQVLSVTSDLGAWSSRTGYSTSGCDWNTTTFPSSDCR